MEDILFKERNNIGSISKLHALCQSLALKPKSSFDPMYKISIKLKSFTNGLQILYNKHSNIYSEIMHYNSLDAAMSIYQDTELLLAYETFYQSGIRLIFNSTATLFRSVDESPFLLLFLQIYSHLKSCLKGVREQQRITHATRSFEKEFFHAFLKAHSNSYQGGNVKDILSFNTNLIQFPNIKSDNIIQSHCIKLDSNKLGFKKLLVEVVELQTNELAFFKIESCNIMDPQIITAEHLLKELIMGSYNLLNFNKSLLFIPLKSKDMKILEYSNNGLKLETVIGNKIQLEITSESVLEWEASWKPKFELYFDNVMELRQKDKKSIFTNALPISNLKNLNIFDKQPHPSTEQVHRDITPSDSVTPKDPYSTILSHHERAKSITEFENLSYEKLLELDNSIPIEISPLIGATSPAREAIRSVSDTFKVEQVDPRISIETDTHEMESIISGVENSHINEDDNDKEALVFNPSASSYKPMLSSKKSSSLLSLFSSNHNSDIESNHDTKLSSNILLPRESSSSIFGNIKHVDEEDGITKSRYISGPSSDDLLGGVELFQDNRVKLSYWSTSNLWEIVGDKQLKLTIEINRLKNGTVIMHAYDNNNREQSYLVTKISSAWKYMKTTAQDIQVKFPKGDVLNHSLSDELETFVMTLRYHNADKLMNILKKSISNDFRKPLSSSSTQETLATNASSNLNESIFSYRTASTASGLSLDKFETQDSSKKTVNKTIQSHLLISSIKGKYHSLERGKIWKLQDVGNITIYSLDLDNNTPIKNRIGASFEFTSNQGTKKFSCHLKNIQRLKRTGIVLQDDNNEYHLLAFTNPLVTDHIFKLVHSLI
ncbi:hypothetical protein MOUN0_M02102 [Monosporozyma unispora]|nr:hypothetical protein C6P44_000862 [Kazachstania unispora]